MEALSNIFEKIKSFFIKEDGKPDLGTIIGAVIGGAAASFTTLGPIAIVAGAAIGGAAGHAIGEHQGEAGNAGLQSSATPAQIASAKAGDAPSANPNKGLPQMPPVAKGAGRG